MRIISGSKRGYKLFTLEGDDVRPTTDRVKESLFNILQFRLEGRRFLDMFAGSGQIGLEALSRGARSATFLETSKQARDVISKNIKGTGFEQAAKLLPGNALLTMQGMAEEFDIAFIDPPYRSNMLLPALEAVVLVMAPTGLIICEHPRDEDVPEQVGAFQKKKSYRYGKIMLTRYECPLNDGAQTAEE